MAETSSRKPHPGFIRNAKVVGGLIVVCVAAVGVAFIAMKNRKAEAAAPDIPAVDARGGTPAQESPHYTQALNRSNQEGLTQAQKTDGTFVPALSDRVGTSQLEQQLQQRASDAQPERVDYQHAGGGNQQAQQLPPLPAPSQGLGTQVQALVTQWDNPPQSQEILGLQQQATKAGTPTVQDNANTSAGQIAQAPQVAKVPIIRATEKYYGRLENGIDTGSPSDVLAILDQGPCKGAVLMGSGKLTGETVSATFPTMTCKGQTVSVNAVALNEQTLSNALPADIDHHLFERVGIPGVLGALGAAGSVFSNAGSTVTQNPLGGVTQVNNPSPSGRQLMGAGVAGGIQGMQSTVQQEVSMIPAISGKVAAQTPIIILFKADVALP